MKMNRAARTEQLTRLRMDYVLYPELDIELLLSSIENNMTGN
jgi:hypothetical protein